MQFQLDDTIPIRLGSSLRQLFSSPVQPLHSVQFASKPRMTDVSTGIVTVNKNGTVLASMRRTDCPFSERCLNFQGTQIRTSDTSHEFVLIYDPVAKEYSLEALATKMVLRPIHSVDDMLALALPPQSTMTSIPISLLKSPSLCSSVNSQVTIAVSTRDDAVEANRDIRSQTLAKHKGLKKPRTSSQRSRPSSTKSSGENRMDVEHASDVTVSDLFDDSQSEEQSPPLKKRKTQRALSVSVPLPVQPAHVSEVACHDTAVDSSHVPVEHIPYATALQDAVDIDEATDAQVDHEDECVDDALGEDWGSPISPASPVNMSGSMFTETTPVAALTDLWDVDEDAVDGARREDDTEWME